jgi:hypothetical protein
MVSLMYVDNDNISLPVLGNTCTSKMTEYHKMIIKQAVTGMLNEGNNINEMYTILLLKIEIYQCKCQLF